MTLKSNDRESAKVGRKFKNKIFEFQRELELTKHKKISFPEATDMLVSSKEYDEYIKRLIDEEKKTDEYLFKRDKRTWP